MSDAQLARITRLLPKAETDLLEFSSLTVEAKAPEAAKFITSALVSKMADAEAKARELQAQGASLLMKKQAKKCDTKEFFDNMKTTTELIGHLSSQASMLMDME